VRIRPGAPYRDVNQQSLLRRSWFARWAGTLVSGDRPSGRMRSLGLVLTLALALTGFNAATAWARAKVGITISCQAVSFSFANFPAGNNEITETIKEGKKVIYKGTFAFNGPSGSNTVAINLSPGEHVIKVHAGWTANGVNQEKDAKAILMCGPPPEPAFTIEKSQRLKGEASYTTAELTAEVGQTVEYKIVVTNTGNVPLKFSKLSDANCEGISPSGEVEIAPGGEQAYTCSHVLDKVGKYSNEASITGNEGTGEKTSNKVTVNVAEPPTCPQAKIESNFNGTAIKQSNWIWFNSVLKPEGTTSGGTIRFTNQKVTIVTKTGTTTLSVPNSTISFSLLATEGTTTFTGGEWVTTVPASFSDNVFLAGLAYQLPAELEGGANPVSWEGDFTTSAGVSLKWQWAAAVYTKFSNEYNSLEVKPLHSTTLDKYHNGNQAGTPEAFTEFVTGGARGGGGSNYTGSYSGTAPCPQPGLAGNSLSTAEQQPVW
jgi:uncharacterized repeat protein (TIGR01451 family)